MMINEILILFPAGSHICFQNHLNVSKPLRLETFLVLRIPYILLKFCLFLATNITVVRNQCFKHPLYKTTKSYYLSIIISEIYTFQLNLNIY